MGRGREGVRGCGKREEEEEEEEEEEGKRASLPREKDDLCGHYGDVCNGLHTVCVCVCVCYYL